MIYKPHSRDVELLSVFKDNMQSCFKRLEVRTSLNHTVTLRNEVGDSARGLFRLLALTGFVDCAAGHVLCL